MSVPLRPGTLGRHIWLKRKTPLKRHRPPAETAQERAAPLAFIAAAAGRGRCANCPSTGRWHPHHAGVEKQELKRLGLPLWDPANALRLCIRCHWRQHYEPGFKLPLSVLSDRTISYAFTVLGTRAYDYLRRRYSGDERRLQAALERESLRTTAGTARVTAAG
jgi:hypothetical protein